MVAHIKNLVRRVGRRIREDWRVALVPMQQMRLGVTTSVRKERVSSYNRAADRIVKRLRSSTETVSFDVFDTLVTRLVSRPDDLHLIVGLELNADPRVPGAPPPRRWHSARIRAERVARDSAPDSDVTLDQIFNELVHIFDPAVVLAGRKHEIRLERLLARPTRRGRMALEAANVTERSVVAATDIYLPGDLIKSILSALSLNVDKVYISGDDGTAKFTGTTFRRMGRELSGPIVHIGDNLVSDVRVPRKNGVAAFHLPDPRPALRVIDSSRRTQFRGLGPDAQQESQQSVLESLVAVKIADANWQIDSLEHIGYSALGPTLLGFAQYVHNRAVENSVTRLSFAAREGKILREAYMALPQSLPSSDALISTRLLGMATLQSPLTEANIEFLAKTPIALSPRDFIKRALADVSDEIIATRCATHGIDPERRYTRREATDRLAPLFREFTPELQLVGLAAAKPAVEYLSSLGLDKSSSALVDIGWAGTIQRAVNSLMNVDTSGFYLGVRDVPQTRDTPSISGWFDERHGGRDRDTFDSLYKRVPILEVLLADPWVGSIASVDRVDDEFVFSRLPREFSDDDAERITRLQRAALHFVADWVQSTADIPSLYYIDKYVAISRLLALATTPSPGQLRQLHKIKFDGTYGLRSTTLGNWWLPEYVRQWR